MLVLLRTHFSKLMKLLGRSQGDALVVPRAQAKNMKAQRLKEGANVRANISSVEDDCRGAESVASSKGVNQDPILGMDFAEELFVAAKQRVRQSCR